MIRIFDVLFSFIGLVLLFPIFIVVFIVISLDGGSPIFKQKRLGKFKMPFMLLKFRTMKLNTESVASHLVSGNSITKMGRFLRKSKLDELPQLWNVLKGNMSLVGPRPNLPNQFELISRRDDLKVYDVLPGITGLAQIKNIDMSTPELLAQADSQMLRSFNVKTYFTYIFKTMLGAGSGDAVNL